MWRVSADPAGIWGSPSVDSNGLYFTVLAGSWLQYRAVADGSLVWNLPVGFDAYTRPVFHGEEIVVCGGDPPDNGFLLRVNPDTPSAISPIDAETRQGEQRDFLSIKCDWHGPAQVSLNLRHLGWSESEQTRFEHGRFTWSGQIEPTKRGAETVILAVGSGAEGIQYRILPLDLGADEMPGELSARALEDLELPQMQTDRRESGGHVIEALARHAGKEIEAAAAESAAAYMRETGLHGHHVWRGGSVRMLMSSTMPLVEETQETRSRDYLRQQLTRWKEELESMPGDAGAADPPEE